jgi:peptide/nickel transport system permease protein
MWIYIVRRTLISIPVVVIATMIVFFGMSAVTDPLSQLRLIPEISQTTLQNIIDARHLDEPIIVQYWFWLQAAIFDGFGTTMLGTKRIWPDLSRALWHTAQLVLVAEALAVSMAVVLGVLAAKKQYSFFDYTTTTISFIGFSVPIFWFALMLQFLAVSFFLATDIRIFYTFGLSSPDPTYPLLDRLQHMALPVIALLYVSVAQYSRYMRGSMLEVLHSDYVRTARAKGLPERTVTMKHALRNALIPLVTVTALNIGAVLGGVVITETIFAWPGMGKLFIDSLNRGELYTLMAWLMVTAIIVIVFNLIADVLYALLDPRIRFD